MELLHAVIIHPGGYHIIALYLLKWINFVDKQSHAQ